ncbi:DUF636 domain-containing protein [Apiospora arundinis]|uniref:DUF636 domain-containing protein n=1 Tax=Apiospora arundinis TaxID=335852 RepID=A0ABR2IVG0_9PEZI
MGVFNTAADQWYISTALFPKDEDVFVLGQHVFTQSAPCGLHEWLPTIGTRELKVWNPDDMLAESAVPQEVIGDEGVDHLLAECHCGSVSFLIQRPTDKVLADDNMRTLVSPVDKMKWKACLDVCNDCRLASGTHVSAWMYIPTLVCDPRNTKMTTYSASPGKQRSFCSASSTKSVSCIAVGILHAPEGRKSDGWTLDAGREYDKELYESLNEAYRSWGMVKDGKLLDFRLIQP